MPGRYANLDLLRFGWGRKAFKVRPRGRAWGAWHTGVIALIITLFALALGVYRLHIAPDILMDEALYFRGAYSIAQTGRFVWSIAAGNGPPGWADTPILVHPPLYFLVQAAAIRVLDLGDEIFHGVYTMRVLTAALGAGTGGLLVWLGARLRNRWVGVLLGLLFAVDPFILRINRRNMLETLAELFSVMAIYLFFIRRRQATLGGDVAIGVLFGAALLAKEIAIFNYLVLIGYALLAWDGVLLRRTLRIGAVMVAVWSAFPLWAWAVGEGREFLDVTTFSLRRLLGLVQVSGWNRPGVSFLQALLVNAPQYATSYMLIALAALYTIWGLWRRRDRQDDGTRLVLAWLVAMGLFFAFTVVRGALNDQFFYLLMVPVLLAVADGLGLAWTRLAIGDSGPRRKLARGLLGVALLVLVAVNLQRWVALFGRGVDNSYYRLCRYIQQSVAPAEPINSSQTAWDPTLAWMLPDYRIVSYRDPDRIREDGVCYAVLSSKDLWGRYGDITPEYAEWLESHGQQVFTTYGNTYWQLTLYRLDSASLSAVDRSS